MEIGEDVTLNKKIGLALRDIRDSTRRADSNQPKKSSFGALWRRFLQKTKNRFLNARKVVKHSKIGLKQVDSKTIMIQHE